MKTKDTKPYKVKTQRIIKGKQYFTVFLVSGKKCAVESAKGINSVVMAKIS